MRSSLARVLTGTALTASMIALGGGVAAASETYTVRSGDTLAGIAASLDGVSSWQQLAEANADIISDPNVIRIGQILTVDGSAASSGPSESDEPDTHTVVSGDTLAGIAGTYASVSSWRQLAEFNADIVSDPNVIRVGQVLALSGSAAPAPAPSSNDASNSSSSNGSSSSSSSSNSDNSSNASSSSSNNASSSSSNASSSSSSSSSSSNASSSTPAPSSSSNVATSTWDRVAECESNGNWSINTGNGYYGGLQFAKSSWDWVGGSGMPHQASKAEQIARAEILLERQGWSAWPACSKKLGLR